MIDSRGGLVFNFWAVRRGCEDRISSTIRIELPAPCGEAGDSRCKVEIEGFHHLSRSVMGATPFQALDLAIAMVKIEMQAHAGEWEFFFTENGPVMFA